MKIVTLTKISGFNTQIAAIHRKDGCKNVKRLIHSDWQENEIEYRDWANHPRACILCARLPLRTK